MPTGSLDWLCWAAGAGTERSDPGGWAEDGPEAEVGDGVLQVREEPLHRVHRGIGHVLQRETHPLLALAQRRDRVPELVAVEKDERPRMRGQLHLDRGAARIVLVEL